MHADMFSVYILGQAHKQAKVITTTLLNKVKLALYDVRLFLIDQRY